MIYLKRIFSALIVLITLFSTMRSLSQRVGELDELIRISTENVDLNVSESMRASKQGLELSQKLNGKVDHRFYIYLGQAYTKLGQLDSAKSNLQIAYKAFQKDTLNLFEVFHTLSNVYRLQGDAEKQMESAIKTYDLARRLNDNEKLVKGWELVALAHQNFGNYYISDSIYAEILSYCQNKDLSCLVEKGNKARALYNLGKYAQAIELFFEIRKSFAEDGDMERVAQTNHHIGYILMLAQLNSEALKYYHLVLAYFQQHQNIEQLSVVNENLGELYIREGQLSNAQRHLQEAKQIKLNDNIPTTGFIDNNLGKIALLKGNLDDANEHLQEALKSFLRQQNRKGEGLARINIAKYHLAKKEFQQSEVEAELSLNIHRELKIYEELTESYGVLISIYKATSRISEALEMQEQLMLIEKELMGPKEIMKISKNLLQEILDEEKKVVSSNVNWFWLPISLLFGLVVILVNLKKKKRQALGRSQIKMNEAESISKMLSEVVQEEQLFLNKELTVGQLAQKLGVSERKLSLVLNQHLEISFHDYINSYRLDCFKQKQKEEGDKYSIVGIAEQSGFPSKSSFYRAFKKSTGLTPSQYFDSKESA